MSLFDLEAATSIVDVAFDSANTSMAVLHRSGIAVYQLKAKGGRSLPPTLMNTISFFDSLLAGPPLRVPLQACFSSLGEISILVHDGDNLKLEVYAFSPGGISLQDVVEVDRSEPISSISSYSGLPDVDAYAQDRSGKLYNLSGKQGLMPLGLRLPAQLPWYQLVVIGDKTVAVGMARNGRLYADSTLLAKNCTSFVVTDAHIIFTTASHFVKFVHLVDPQGKCYYACTSGHVTFSLTSPRHGSPRRRSRAGREMPQHRTRRSARHRHAYQHEPGVANAQGQSRDHIPQGHGCRRHSTTRRGEELWSCFFVLSHTTCGHEYPLRSPSQSVPGQCWSLCRPS